MASRVDRRAPGDAASPSVLAELTDIDAPPADWLEAPDVASPAPPVASPPASNRERPREHDRRPVDPSERLPRVLTDLRVRRIGAALLAAVLLTAAALTFVGGSGEREVDMPQTAPAAAVDLDGGTARVARADFPLVDVYARPDDRVAVSTLEHPTPRGAPLVFLVESTWEDWLEVRLPGPPSGRTGWIRAEHVVVSERESRVVVDLASRLVLVEVSGDTVLRVPAAVGRSDAPEPGLTYVTESVALADTHHRYGSHALLLAGYPNGADDLFRGSGLVAIHGVDDPVALGQVTRGSIGLAEADLQRLHELAPPGTPVEVVAADGS